MKNKRTSTQEDPSALMRPRTKQTDMFSCFMRTQETKKQNLCMNTHDEYYKIAVMTDAGASETVASAEMSYPIEKTTTSGTTYSSSAEHKQRTPPTSVSDTFESLTIAARKVGPSLRCASKILGKRLQGWWNLNTQSEGVPYKTTMGYRTY